MTDSIIGFEDQPERRQIERRASIEVWAGAERRAGGVDRRANAMFTIELTRARVWNAPAVETHTIERAVHVGDVERLAEQLLTRARSRNYGATGYRIIDATGRRIRVKQP
jgi:hypothetical protein